MRNNERGQGTSHKTNELHSSSNGEGVLFTRDNAKSSAKSKFETLILIQKGEATVYVYPKEAESFYKRFRIHVIAIPLVLLKVLSSSGLRLYGMEDYFFNKDYLLYDSVVSKVPDWLRVFLIVYGVFADGHMNGLTRGPSTYNMVSNWFHKPEEATAKASRGKCANGCIRFGSWVMNISGVIATIAASLSTFLGVVTVCAYLTDDETLLLFIGIVCAVANFGTTISYRFRKAADNFTKMWEGKLRFPKWWEAVIGLLSTAAFVGLCDYGTSHSIRKFLDLVNWYEGDPDTHQKINPYWENIIYGITNFTLPPSALTYLFGQFCEMLAKRKEITPGLNSFTVRLSDVRRNFYAWLNSSESGLARSSYPTWPTMIKIFGVYLTGVFVLGELFGNSLLMLNGCSGLLIRLFDWKNELLVGLAALGLALINIPVYWHFNIKDWWWNANKCFISAGMKLTNVGETDVENYAQNASKIFNASNNHNSVTFWSGGFYGQKQTAGYTELEADGYQPLSCLERFEKACF